MNFSPKRTLLAGLLLIAVVNVFVLGGVAYNRSGEPDSTLRLSERELRVPHVWSRSMESSGLALTLDWRVLAIEASDVKQEAWQYYSYRGAPAWLDPAKMASLGFDISLFSAAANGRRAGRRDAARDVLLVLELNGAAYQASLARAIKYDENKVTRPNETAEERAKVLKREQTQNSRLFVIDAGLDASALRAKYPDRSRFAILRGQVRPSWQRENSVNTLTGMVSALSVEGLNVSPAMRSVFEGASADRGDSEKSLVRYDVDVAVGQRLEPWIAAAVRKTP